MAKITVERLTRRFGKTIALNDVSFEVGEGQFVSLLGPSGCGKSTTLAALAGLDKPSAGRISIGERVVFDSERDMFVEAQLRNCGLMFQSYALWPHMTVEENLRFPLDVRGLKEAEKRARIERNLRLVQMHEYAKRYPGELSGGQQQRVALARTLVYGPEVLLLDEPLSNLDAKLRDQARVWLRDLQRETGVTTVYVTHDQSEALALSDTIFVMANGRIAQSGSPQEIYERPATPFVADFVGAANLLDASFVSSVGNAATVALPTGEQLTATAAGTFRAGDPLMVAIRPEKVAFGDDLVAGKANGVAAKVIDSSYQGSRYLHHFRIGEQVVRADSPLPLGTEETVVRLPADALLLYVANSATT